MSADPHPPDGAPTPSSRTLFFRILPSIMLPMFLAMVDQTIVATALPSIAADLGHYQSISWVVVAYLVTTTIAAPVYGSLGDLVGRRHLMHVGLAIAMGASLVCALATSLQMLIIGRILQGLGAGGLMTLSQALIGEAVPPRDRARFQGYLSAVAVSASTFGPVVGGFLTQHLGWQSIFYVNLPIAALGMVLILRLPAHAVPRPRVRFDFPGLLIFATFIASTLLTLESIREWQPDSMALAAGLAVTAVLSVVLLIRREQRASVPLLPLPLLRHPAIWRSDAIAACHGALVVSLMTFMPIYLRVVRGATSSEIGLLLLPMTIGIGVGSMLTGRLVSRTGRTAVFPSVGLIVVVTLLIGLSFWSEQLPNGWLAAYLGLTAIFIGTVMGVVQVTVQVAAGPKALGSAAASVQFSRSLGAGFGTTIVSVVLFMSVVAADPEFGRLFGALLQQGEDLLASLPPDQRVLIRGEAAHAFRYAFLTIASFSVMSMLLSWTLPLRRI